MTSPPGTSPDDPEAGPAQPADTGAGSPESSPDPGHDLRALVLGVRGQWLEAEVRLQKLEETAATVDVLLDRFADMPDLDTTPDTPDSPPDTDDENTAAPPEPEPFDMRRLVGWVRENVTSVVERAVATQATTAPYWCRQWWQHPEAIVRFEATRRSWTVACEQADGDAMSTYLQHLDHHLAVLMGPAGTFCRCKPDRHHPGPLSARCLGHDEPDEAFYARDDHDRHHPAASAPGPGATDGGAAAHPTPYPRHGSGTNGAKRVPAVDQHRLTRGRGW